jgi:hypothetical protein
MVVFFQVLIVVGFIVFVAIMVIGTQAMIEDWKSPNQGRNEEFLKKIRRNRD